MVTLWKTVLIVDRQTDRHFGYYIIRIILATHIILQGFERKIKKKNLWHPERNTKTKHLQVQQGSSFQRQYPTIYDLNTALGNVYFLGFLYIWREPDLLIEENKEIIKCKTPTNEPYRISGDLYQ